MAKANVEAGNQPSATLIDRDFATELVATGTERLENPSGVITQFGLLSSGVNTEPDQNTYVKWEKNLVCSGVDYGRNFLFQGHENAGNLALCDAHQSGPQARRCPPHHAFDPRRC